MTRENCEFLQVILARMKSKMFSMVGVWTGNPFSNAERLVARMFEPVGSPRPTFITIEPFTSSSSFQRCTIESKITIKELKVKIK